MKLKDLIKESRSSEEIDKFIEIVEKKYKFKAPGDARTKLNRYINYGPEKVKFSKSLDGLGKQAEKIAYKVFGAIHSQLGLKIMFFKNGTSSLKDIEDSPH